MIEFSKFDRKYLQEHGIFSTPPELAETASNYLLHSVKDKSFILDPMYGYGELLQVCMKSLSLKNGVSPYFCGIELNSNIGTDLRNGSTNPTSNIEIKYGDFRDFPDILAKATHVIANPPFNRVVVTDSPLYSGLTNNAAVLTLDLIKLLNDGTEIVLILPDVLRSGTRYDKWRKQMSRLLTIHDITSYGKFSNNVDVDVFIIHGTYSLLNLSRDINWYDNLSSEQLGRIANITVGSVVNFRDPKVGNNVPYLTYEDFKLFSNISVINKKRLYSGTLVKGPFFAIRRTSSPKDNNRIAYTRYNMQRYVAIDNHFIVIKPYNDDDMDSIQSILEKDDTRKWLNKRIRCRHLTVTSVSEIPIGG